MNTVLRRIRGIIGAGLTWGVAWAILGGLLGIVIRIVAPEQLDGGETALGFARILGMAGFISGAGFAATLALFERGRTLREVSLLRVAAWGIAGGIIVPLLTSVHDGNMIWTAPLGAALATGTIALARRADRQLAAGEMAGQLADQVGSR